MKKMFLIQIMHNTTTLWFSLNLVTYMKQLSLCSLIEINLKQLETLKYKNKLMGAS